MNMDKEPSGTQKVVSPLAEKLIKYISYTPAFDHGKKISVDQVVAEVASFYEKIRNAMEYQEEEVVFRVAVQRVLNRRLLLESNGEKIAEPLIRELAWAKYFPDNTIPESLIKIIGEKIDLYIKLYEEVPKRHRINKNLLYEWIVQVMSADIALTINPNKNTQIVASFMYHIFQKKIKVDDDTEENRNALIFINIRRAFAKDDRPFLRYLLFSQYFGKFDNSNFENIQNNFLKGYKKIEQTLVHPLNEQIYTYLKKQSVPFLIFTEMLNQYGNKIGLIVRNQEQLETSILNICDEKYSQIHKRVRTAIIRSVIFLLATKAVFALFIEGGVERQLYGHVSWGFLSINTLTPPILMFFSMFFIKIPDKKNSDKIINKIKSILYSPQISEIEEKTFSLHSKENPLNTVFISLWLVTMGLVVWAIATFLSLFNVNFISQLVFIFFLIIVSFLIFRINLSSKTYNVNDENQGFGSVLFYFTFMPFVLLGRRLTLSFSKINVILLFFDFVIETPFKTLFSFFEQWFTFLRSQKEKLE